MNLALPGPAIAGEEALAAFRQGLTGAHALNLLVQAKGRLLLQLPVGVGKTHWLAAIAAHALQNPGDHDLVIILVPRWDILRELAQRLPEPPVILRPRPRRRCGPLNADWMSFEQHGCGQLGRVELCARCPIRRRCPWPTQFGPKLRRVRLILTTQQHLVLDPFFLSRLCHHTRASRPLLLLDESDLLLRRMDRLVSVETLRAFEAAQAALRPMAGTPDAVWLERTDWLLHASTADLQAGDWSFPQIETRWAVAVQRQGRKQDPNFSFPAYDLHALARSDPWSRERRPDGSLRFAALPDLGDNFIIFSGSIARDLARYRLDPNHEHPVLVSPFAEYRFEHPETRWYNFRFLAGAARYFPANASRLLDFFAFKLAANLRAGRRTLLVARKKFVPFCAEELTKRLRDMGLPESRIVTRDWDSYNWQDSRLVPLLNYGVAGINRFEHFDAAFCLTGYYVDARTVAQALQDLDESSARVPLVLESGGDPPRRRVRLLDPQAQNSILPSLAAWTFTQKEADVVVQAVGRVRPFTRPREIITFQLGDLPGVRYNVEFRSLEQARAYFRVPTRRQARRERLAEEVGRLRALGLSRRQMARHLGISLSTVKRSFRQQTGGGHEIFQ
jgi:hypothetical protein